MNFSELFRGYSKRHGKYRLTDKQGNKYQGRAVTAEGAPQEKDFEEHLQGVGAGLGVIPLLDDGENVYFGVIDIDRYDLDFVKLEKDAAQLPLVITKSKSGGAHLWLFCKDPVAASLVQKRLGEWAAALGFGGCEIFPKQVRRDTANGDAGNWINLPYFGDTRRCFLQGVEVALDVFLAHAETRLMNAATLKAIKVMKGDLFVDGPPCLQYINEHGLMEGSRNTTLLNMGVYFKQKFGDGWEDELVKYNLETLKHNALANSEIQTLIKSLNKKDYHYQCNVAPLCTHCNKRECLVREFGVGSSKEDLPFMMGGLTKLLTDPPIWFLDVDNVRFEFATIDDLLNIRTFKVMCAEKLHKIIPMVVGKKWDAICQELLNNVQVIDAPDDASDMGMFSYHLQQFIEGRMQDESRDKLVSGNVWADGEHVYFRIPDLIEHLKRQRIIGFNVQKVWSILREDYAGVPGQFNIKGACVKYWRVNFDNVQKSAFDVPNVAGPEI